MRKRRPYRRVTHGQRELTLDLAAMRYLNTDIARWVGIPYPTVRTVLFQARKAGDPRAVACSNEERGWRAEAGRRRAKEARA